MKIGLVVCPTLVKQPFQALKQMELIMQQQVKNAYDLLVFHKLIFREFTQFRMMLIQLIELPYAKIAS